MTEVELAVIGSCLDESTRQEAVFLAPDALFCSDEGKTLIAGVRALQAQGYPVTGESLTIHLQVEAGVDKDTASSWVAEALARRASKENLGFMVASLTQSKVQAMAKEMSEEVGRMASSARIGDLLAKIGEFQRDLALLDNQRAQTYEQAMRDLVTAEPVKFFTPLIKTISGSMSPLEKVFQMDEGGVCYLAGRSAGGKTAMMLNILMNNAEAGHNVAVLEIEMRRKPLAARLAGMRSSLNTRALATGTLNPAEREHLEHCIERDKQTISRIRGIEPSVFHANMLRPTIERWRDEWGCELVGIDYVQVLQAKGSSDRERVSAASRAITEAAKETGVAVIALSQARRSEGDVAMQDFRDSSQLENDAETMAVLNQADGYVSGDRVRPVWLELVKNRSGFLTKDLLHYDLPTQTFTHSGEFGKVQAKEEKSAQFPFK